MSQALSHLQGCLRLPLTCRHSLWLFLPEHLSAFLVLSQCYFEPSPSQDLSSWGGDGHITPSWNSWWNCLCSPLIRCDLFKFRDSISLCVTCVWSCRHQVKGSANDLSIWANSSWISELYSSLFLTSEIMYLAKVNKQIFLHIAYDESQVSTECHPRYLGCTRTDDDISSMKSIWYPTIQPLLDSQGFHSHPATLFSFVSSQMKRLSLNPHGPGNLSYTCHLLRPLPLY